MACLRWKGFSQEEFAQTEIPVDLSWQTATMDTVEQNKLFRQTDWFEGRSPFPAQRLAAQLLLGGMTSSTLLMDTAVPVELSSVHRSSH